MPSSLFPNHLKKKKRLKRRSIMESSHLEDDQECFINDFHTLPHPKTNFEDKGTRVEEQGDLFNDLSWRLALQFVLEEKDGKVREGLEEEEVSLNKRKILIFLK
ncbi:unnamed protein product [Linum trigynum]|uniref:Uncharacterized protein n=1 Tax=Linum trigynum TaxID=586398 RepID=A0AAV2CJZ1_9ROSI